MDAPLQFGKVAVRGSLVTGVSQGIKIGLQFLSVVVMARLLLPEDFGLVAAVGPIVAFVALFQNLGLQQAIVQRRTISDAELNRSFWIMAMVGLGCTVIVIAISPLVAWFYGDPRMRNIAVVAALPLLIGSMSGVPFSLLNRNLRFGKLALADVLSALFGFLAAAGSAWWGLSYWSLLIGSAASAIVSLAAAWKWCRWTPCRPDFGIDREILSFGANLTGFNIVNFFSRNLDNILIGRYSGAIELGYYDRAYKLLLFPIQNIVTPLSRIMIPLLARVQDDKPRFRELYLQVLWALAFVTIPGVAALTCVSDQLVDLLFGPKWAAVSPIFVWLGLAGLIQSTNNTASWILICQGRTKTMFRWGLYGSATTIAAFFVGLPWGVAGVAAAYAISGYVLRLPVLTAIVQRIGPVSAFDFLLAQALYVGSSILAWLVFRSLPASLARSNDLLAIIVAVALSYLFAAIVTLLVPKSRVMSWIVIRKFLGAIR
ncbi:MAG: lipopolysaccharide biosynthesis protein [Rhizobiaceae bacterium]